MTQETDAATNIETDRLLLRAPNEADVDEIAALANNWAVVQHLGMLPHPYGRQDAVEFIARRRSHKTADIFAVTLKDESGALIGIIGLGFSKDADSHELGYWFGQPYWGCGYATEAARAAICYTFDGLSVSALVSGCRPENPASRKVLEKCGFVLSGTGTMKSRPLGRTVEIDRFALTRERWRSLTMAAHDGCTQHRSG